MKRISSFIFFIFLAVSSASVTFAQSSIVVKGPESAARIEYSIMDDNKLLISADDDEGAPIRGLTKEDFTVLRGEKKAKILSLEPLETSRQVELNIIMVVDNSSSMKQRKAVQPVLFAMDNILKILRPIDNFTIIAFQDGETLSFNEYKLHVITKQSSSAADLKAFLNEIYGNGLTEKTYLYEAMLAGLSFIRKMPPDAHKFLVVFSDGEDINSAFESSLVRRAANNILNFEAYAVDYMPVDQLDPFLSSFSESQGGEAWKANEAADLAPIFEKVSSKLIHRYILSYKFLYPPKGSAFLSPSVVNVEEVTTIDSSPMLNHVYFDKEESAIDDRYRKFSSQDQTKTFSETALRGGLEKYHQVLNVIGSRLREKKTANILLVGCNSNHGVEKGRTDISRARAESVKAYLQYIWGISADRMAVQARNLPEIPSTSRIEEGRQENQRVEIHCDQPGILDPVQSTYLKIKSDVNSLRLQTDIDSKHGLESWEITVISEKKPVWSTSGQNDFSRNIILPSKEFTPEKLSGFQYLKAKVAVIDVEGQAFETTTAPVPINFIQKKRRLARNLGYMVEEKYALILFDFDRAEIKDRNAAVVKKIVDRIKERPDAAVNIVGHTDNIGKEKYNIKLSERRAKAVYDQIMKYISPEESRTIQYSGLGPFEPINPNDLPENRALNRTVTVTLVYESFD